MAKVKPKGKHPGGRPSRYSAALHPKLGRALALRGLTDEQMAAELEITRSTFYKWKKEKPEFSDALKKAKEEPDDAVERSLFERALGYEHPEEKVHFDKYGNVHTYGTTKRYPPSETAMIFWLKNRRPEKWRDKQEIEHSGGVIFEAPAVLDD